MGKRALVSGGAGFIGSHLCDCLVEQGWAVRVLDNFSTGSRDNLGGSVEALEGDITDPAACATACVGVDTVFHLAARVTIRQSIETFHKDAETNLMGTLNLLRASGASGVRRFIATSSMAVYADSPDGKLVDENHPLGPLSPYGISKLAAEQYVHLMAPQLGMEPVVLRLFNTYGSRQGYTPYVGALTIFVTQILQGKPCTIFGDGEQCRDFGHVLDVARAFVLAADSKDAVGETFNIGTGMGTTVNRLAELIRNELGEGEFNYAKPHPAELRHSVPDISKAKSLLGHAPANKLEDRLGDVIESIRKSLDS